MLILVYNKQFLTKNTQKGTKYEKGHLRSRLVRLDAGTPRSKRSHRLHKRANWPLFFG